jgi:hypothetical protein
MFIVLVVISPAAALTIGPFETPEDAEVHADALRAKFSKRGYVVRVHELTQPEVVVANVRPLGSVGAYEPRT